MSSKIVRHLRVWEVAEIAGCIVGDDLQRVGCSYLPIPFLSLVTLPE